MSTVQPEELESVFAQNVRKRRGELGLTQRQLADMLEVHPPYISDIERGVKMPYLGNVARFAEALSTTPENLLRTA